MSAKKKETWKELPTGGIILEPGSAEEFKTGDWATKKPMHMPDKCINCLFCWMNCPDNAIIVKDGKVVGIDYDHCKGCGICMYECPVKGKALKMCTEEELKSQKK